MNKGYIGITDNNWAEFISSNNINTVNFWCKNIHLKLLKKEIFFSF